MWKPTGELAFSSAGLRGAAAGVTCLLTGFLLLLSGTGHPEEPPAAGTGFSAYIRTLTRERRAVRSPRSSTLHGPVEHLSQDDLFIAVKSTRRYHPDRLELLLDTWISRNLPQIYRPPKVARYKEHHLLFGSKVTLEELQRSITQTYVFTDGEDERLEKKMGAHLINTNCSAAHTRQALSCKMALEYDTFLNSAKKWFCHVDDDNYLNVGSLLKLLSQYSHTQDVYIGRPSLERPIEATETLSMTETKQVSFWFATGGAGFCLSHGLALKMKPWASGGTFMATADHIRLPDDCTVGYIVEALLGGCLTRSALFHSHLENLGVVTDIHNQVTLSYGTVENRRNTVHVKGPFSTKEDPTRFRSVHCLLYPDTSWCPSLL